jgi:hypothetical protein
MTLGPVIGSAPDHLAIRALPDRHLTGDIDLGIIPTGPGLVNRQETLKAGRLDFHRAANLAVIDLGQGLPSAGAFQAALENFLA